MLTAYLYLLWGVQLVLFLGAVVLVVKIFRRKSLRVFVATHPLKNDLAAIEAVYRWLVYQWRKRFYYPCYAAATAPQLAAKVETISLLRASYIRPN